jgi:hypothetical protein
MSVKLERKSPFGRPMCRWENNIKMDVINCGEVWIGFIWRSIRDLLLPW